MQVAKKKMDYQSEPVYQNDVMYERYAQQRIEEGLSDIRAGQTISHEPVVKKSLAFPVDGLGPWPAGLSLHRQDIYGDERY